MQVLMNKSEVLKLVFLLVSALSTFISEGMCCLLQLIPCLEEEPLEWSTCPINLVETMQGARAYDAYSAAG
jgi:hypothetical protein